MLINSINNFLDDPDAPTSMMYDIRKDKQNGCILHLAWNSPTNIAREELSHYMININGTTHMNETSTMTSIHMCTCDHHHIGIIAVNRCGRTGPSTPNITLDKEPKRLHEFGCSTTTNVSSDNQSLHEADRTSSIARGKL